MPSLPVFRFNQHCLYFGKNLKIGIIALFLNLLFIDQVGDSAAGLGLVLAVPEPAGFLSGFFKSGEVGGKLCSRDVDQAEIVEAGGVDEFAAAAEAVEGGDGGGVAAAFFAFADGADLQVDLRQEAVENGTFADSGRADEGAPVLFAEKIG